MVFILPKTVIGIPLDKAISKGLKAANSATYVHSLQAQIMPVYLVPGIFLSSTSLPKQNIEIVGFACLQGIKEIFQDELISIPEVPI